MDIDYGKTDARYTGPETAVEPEPYLTRIAPLASSIEDSAARVNEFIARCRGGGMLSKGEAAAQPMPSGHFAQISRLADAAQVLENLTRDLNSIG